MKKRWKPKQYQAVYFIGFYEQTKFIILKARFERHSRYKNSSGYKPIGRFFKTKREALVALRKLNKFIREKL